MNKNIDKSMFELVQENDRLLDKPLQSKQLSYFQDAMLRFTRNRYNVIATIILIILILMSIFVPIITPARFYEETNSSLTTLPPRFPLIENLGIMDGTKLYEEQPVNPDEIDPETGLGIPALGFDEEYIDMSTLVNYTIVGTERNPLYVGGTNELYVNTGKLSGAVISTEALTYFDNYEIVVDIETITDTGALELLFFETNDPGNYESFDDALVLGVVTSSGVTTIDVSNTLSTGDRGYLVLRYVLDEPSTNGLDLISFNSVRIESPDTEDSVAVYEGYDLAAFPFFVLDSSTENGRFLRRDAEMIVADFVYDEYAALFGDFPKTIGSDEYFRILQENPGMEESIIPDPENPEAWTFEGTWPISAVTEIDTISIGGTEYSNYKVQMDGAYSLGFEDIPYFLFGTDVFGKDLFVLIWLGLRTSLLLGFLSAIVNIVLGIIWGATSAYYGGQVDMLMERFTDIWGSFPQITMIGIITSIIGPGFMALFIFMVYDGWIGAAKVTRFQFYRYKGSEYVLAARTLGASDRRIIFKHILPNALGTIVTRVVLSIPTVIFLEVNLSFLGFGIGNGRDLTIGPISLTGTSIGVILNDGQQQLFAGNYWMIIFPALIVMILMITFNMFGNALRDALNPQLRGSE